MYLDLFFAIIPPPVPPFLLFEMGEVRRGPKARVKFKSHVHSQSHNFVQIDTGFSVTRVFNPVSFMHHFKTFDFLGKL